MNQNKKILIAVVTFLALGTGVWFYFSKKEKPQPAFECLHGQTEIYEKYKNAVVLVKHTYSLKFKIKDSQPFSIDVDTYGLQDQAITGTGFFISEDGKIATNHHVVEPWKYDTNNSYSLDYLKEHIAAILPDSIATSDIKSYLEKNWETYNEDGEDYEGNEEDAATDVTNDTLQTTTPTEEATAAAPATPEFKTVSIDDIEITPVTKEISIALHGSNDEWLPCKVLTISDEEEVDVATIQTQDEALPSKVKNIIDIETAISDDASLKPGTKAILIGYPMGMTLANTRKGIMVQTYEGQISKESDGISIQYNITSTHGASGSPIFNECGQLIAINYAGYDEAQGYNFGIVAKYVQKIAN